MFDVEGKTSGLAKTRVCERIFLRRSALALFVCANHLLDRKVTERLQFTCGLILYKGHQHQL